MNHNLETLPTQFSIEEPVPDDAEGIFDVQRKTWIATYPNESEGISIEDVTERIEGKNGELVALKVERLRDAILSGTSKLFVAKMNDKVVGFVRPNFNEDDKQYRLGGLYVLPETQGTGIGYALASKSIDHIGRDKDIYLHVVSYNENAIRFYERLGFIKTGKEVGSALAALPSGKRLPEIEMLLPASH